MNRTEPLKYGHFYHIYNRGVSSCDLFCEADNYEHFLGLYDKYISPVAETFAWVLMPNHFHLLVRMKEEEEIGIIPSKPLPGSATTERVEKSVTPSAVIYPDGGLTAFRGLQPPKGLRWKRTHRRLDTPMEV